MPNAPSVSRPRSFGLPTFILVVLYIALTFGPAFAASLIGGANAPTYWPLLARVSGIAALAMFLMQFVTSGRYETISGRIGLDRSMSFHRVAGYGAVLMVAVHITAFLLRGRAVWSVETLWARFVGYLVDPDMLTGVIAIALALVLVPAAVWLRRGPLPYAVWRVLHGLLALGIGGFALHHAITNARFASDIYGSTTIYLLAGIAVLALGSVHLIRPFWAYRKGFRVKSARDLNPSVTELVLEAPEASRFSFAAGQFAWLTVNGRHTITDNPFSIASAPSELPELKFLIRKVGDMTNAVWQLQPGQKVGVDGPHGSFSLAEAGPGPLVLIAGGIGIAPIRSILKHIELSGDSRPIRLLVTARSPGDHIVRAEIEDMRQGRDMEVLYVVEDSEGEPGFAQNFSHGRCERKFVAQILKDIDRSESTAFVCGPPKMMDAAVSHLLALGLRQNQIVMERFDYNGAKDPISARLRRKFLALLAVIFIGTAGLAWWVFDTGVLRSGDGTYLRSPVPEGGASDVRGKGGGLHRGGGGANHD